MLTEIKNGGRPGGVYRGLRRACGGQPDSITARWPLSRVHRCIIHLIRNTSRFACGHFPNAAAVLERLCLVTGSPEPTRGGRTHAATRRKPALNTFALPSKHKSTNKPRDQKHRSSDRPVPSEVGRLAS